MMAKPHFMPFASTSVFEEDADPDNAPEKSCFLATGSASVHDDKAKNQ